MTKEEKLHQLNQIFTPSSPIKERDLFIGRIKQLTRVQDAINTTGQHVVLYGERGVGKTSLANIMANIYTNLYPVKITCNKHDTFQELWYNIFSNLSTSRKTLSIGYTQYQKDASLNIANEYYNAENCNLINNILSVLDKLPADKLLFIFDEFDSIADEKTRQHFAALIKNLSDNYPNVTILLVGIAENISELLTEHLSVERCLKQIKMPRMTDEECKDIITSGLKRLEISISQNTINEIINYASGFPHYIHLICNLGASELISNNKSDFTSEYLTISIRKAIENSSASLQHALIKAIGTTDKNSKWSKIIHACAISSCDENNSFTLKDVEKSFLNLRNEQTKISYHVNKLCKEDRGLLLQKHGQGKNTRYKFSNPMMRAIIKLKMHPSKLIK